MYSYFMQTLKFKIFLLVSKLGDLFLYQILHKPLYILQSKISSLFVDISFHQNRYLNEILIIKIISDFKMQIIVVAIVGTSISKNFIL